MQFKRNHLLRAATAILTTAVLSIASAQTQSEIHRSAATKNVGDDTFMMQNARAFYCNLADDNNAIVIAARATNSVRIPLTQIFDDVWVVGSRYVAQYIIKTPDGFVMVDAGNNATEVQTYNFPALQLLGLNSQRPLKEIFLTHGHSDHDGGAKWLLDNLGAQSWLGSADAAGKSYAPKLIDSTKMDVQEISIGGKTFWVLATPGHTPGSTSAVLNVKDHGRDVKVLINGGQSMTNSIPDVVKYLDSIERTYKMAKAMNVEGVMTPHIYWDGTVLKIDDINAKGRTKPGQFIFGRDTVLRQLAVARECSAAWLTRLDTTKVLPVWRHNTLSFEGAPETRKVAAKLVNGWGPVVGQQVKFSVAGSAATCTATTDSSGVATCENASLVAGTVTASFAGAESSEFVDLAATTDAVIPPPPSSAPAATLEESAGGCTIGSGRFDPILIGVALLAALAAWRRSSTRRRS